MSSLLRSTKFVRYFTGAARTLILNSAKVEANSLINPKALCAANNVLMRDYATTKKTENLEPLLQKLDSEVRRFGRITKKDIDEVFDEIQSKNNITSSQSLLVIRCCGELVPEELPEQRTLLVQKIWNVLTERGIPMDISHYNALLRVYIENEHPFSPAKFLEELEKKGLQANRVTYQRLMWRYCQEGDVEGATKVLERMRELNLPVSEPVLNALVMGHAFHGDTDGAKAVLETMAAAGLEPSDRTYTLLACGFARKGDIDGVESTLKAAQNKDIYFSDKDILEIIEHLALYNHGDKVEQIFPHLQKGFGYNQEVCNLILRLLNKGQIETAKKVMKTMPKSNNVEDTIFKGAFFVKQLLKVNRPVDEIVNICRELKQEELVPNAFFIATETALTLGKTELAQRLFKELNTEGVEIRQHYYWPLLVQKGKENDEEGLLQILRDMAANGVPATGEALKDYVLPYLIGKDTPQNIILKLQIANIPVIQSARNLTNELLESGEIKQAADVVLQYRLRKNYASIANPLIKALSKTKDIGSFATILHVLSSKPQGTQGEEDTLNDSVDGDSNNDINEISRIVKNALKNLSKPDLCESLLNAIYSKGLRINTESAQEIEQYLGENMTTSISQLLTKLTSSDIEIIPLESIRKGGPVVRTTEQLEGLIARLKEKDGSNITRLQKQLLVSYIKDNNVDKVSSYVEELKSSSFEVTPGTWAQLFEFYCENNEIEKAQQCQEEIAKISPEFELNKFKVIQMVYALVRQNRYDDAINYLKSDKHKADDPTSFLLNSKCWQMLNYLAEQKDSAKVLEMTDVLLKSNVVEPSNILLGPSIKVHLLNDDIDGALKQFEACCKQYSSTPWKGELMKALIMKEDASKLQWLADLSTQVHGEVNILHDLVLAFVECGRLRQARRILETPGLQARHKRLDDACQRYVEEGKSEYLEGLLEATKELSHIDRSNIFYHLLVTYCKANETDKALGLWTILQEEGEVPSDQFLKYLGNHLRSKNREVPFIIPDDKKVMDNAKTDVILQKVIKPNEVSKPTKKEISTSVELLVNDGKAQQAADLVIKSLQNGVIPQSNVFKYLLKVLAESGNVEKVQQLGNYINESMKRRVTYDDKLTLAIFNRGAGPQHVNNILEALKAANTDKDIETALKKFPRSNALASVIQDENVIAICNEIVDIAAKHGITLPANLLWMEYLLANKEKEADALWNKWLNGAPTMVFRRLLQESHTRKQPENIEKLINLLKQNKTTTPVTLGNVYSRLVNYYIVENDTSKAEAVLEECLKLGVQIEHINKTTLKRLKEAVENAGRQFKFSF